MALNPYFQQGATSEQNLVQDLINEQLRMYGVEIYYLPRQYMKKNTVIKEVVESKFTDAYPIEAYVDTYEGYEGVGTLLSKFGIQELDDLNLIISQERYSSYITPLIKNIPNIELSTRPKEGDLIYFPLGDRLFEIKYVEHEKPFYQLQKNYVYELRCELFRYEDEVVDVGVDDIDDTVIDKGYIQTLTLVTDAVQATAITGIVTEGGLRTVTLTNRGYNYVTSTSTQYPPRVAISSVRDSIPGSTNKTYTAVGIATLIDNIINCDGVLDTKVQGVEIRNPGYGYSVAPGIGFIHNTGVGAAATSEIADGTLGIVTITEGGSGYITEPIVTIAAPGVGTTATARAVISTAGIVTAIRWKDAGVGYTGGDTPTLTIAAPDTSAFGDYAVGETVTGAASSTTGIVNSWDASTGILELKIVDGTWTKGEDIVGASATREVRIINTDDLVTPYADNDNIETAADDILDFSKKNPFGDP
tara:strand:+ start:4085 stop:5506 length:1422 start_codon:yes stop_codon:yes gene_type:complete